MKHNGDSITFQCPANVNSVQLHRVDVKTSGDNTTTQPSDMTLQTGQSKTITLIEGGGDNVDITITLTSWHITDPVNQTDNVETPGTDTGDLAGQNGKTPGDILSGQLKWVAAGVIATICIIGAAYWYFFIHKKKGKGE
jgi:hypothetical protein